MKRHAVWLLVASATLLLGCADSSSDLAAVERAVQERAEDDLDFGVVEAVCVTAEGSDRRYECEARTEEEGTYSYSAIKGEGDRVVVERLKEPGAGGLPGLGPPDRGGGGLGGGGLGGGGLGE